MSIQMTQDELDEAIADAYRAGALAMRERAEEACMNLWTSPPDAILCGDTIDTCAAAIRALEVDDE